MTGKGFDIKINFLKKYIQGMEIIGRMTQINALVMLSAGEPVKWLEDHKGYATINSQSTL
jgi:hypothetical protein